MKFAKKLVGRILILIPIFGIVLLMASYYAMPQLTRCYFVQYNDDFFQREGVYISKNTPQWVQDSLLKRIQLAKDRNDAFWEGMKSDPTVIFCHRKWRFERMGVKGNPASTWLSLAGAYVVLGPSAFNLDIISHELCHAELQAQVGWFARDKEIPTWFDEGLAMQLDYRKRYAEKNLTQFGASLLADREVMSLEGPEDFFSSKKEVSRLRYIRAKKKVRQWLGEHPRARLAVFVSHIREGKSFEEAFQGE